MRPRPRGGRAGLTLVELIVAVSLLAVISLLLAGAVHGVRRVHEGIRARDRRVGEPAAVLRALVREVESAFDPALPDRIPFELRPGRPGDPEPLAWRFFAAMPESDAGEPDRFRAREIRYSVRRDRDGMALLRAERTIPDGLEEEPSPVPVISGLREIRIEAGDGAEWSDRWPEEKAPPFPDRVRVRLLTGGGTDAELTAETVVPPALAYPSSIRRSAGP